MAKRKLVAIEILPVAKQDLQEIVDFIAQGSIKYANLEKRLIIEAINKLYYFPELGSPFSYKSIDARKLVLMSPQGLSQRTLRRVPECPLCRVIWRNPAPRVNRIGSA